MTNTRSRGPRDHVAAPSLGSGWSKSLLNPTKRSNLPRDALIMHTFAETCAWSDLFEPPPLKRLLKPLGNRQYFHTCRSWARRKIPIYCQILAEMGDKNQRSILTGRQFNLSVEPYVWMELERMARVAGKRDFLYIVPVLEAAEGVVDDLASSKRMWVARSRNSFVCWRPDSRGTVRRASSKSQPIFILKSSSRRPNSILSETSARHLSLSILTTSASGDCRGCSWVCRAHSNSTSSSSSHHHCTPTRLWMFSF